MASEQPDRYDIQEELGRGGTAAVYRAYDRTLERFVALKVLSGPIANDPEFLARFEREARVAARLDHPNIVSIYDVGTLPDSRPFIAMRLLDGQGLDSVLAAGPLPWDRTVEILKQIASALDYTHARDTVHRDIKPSNVIIDPAGQATLTDFGIARALDSARVTLTGLTVGTPRYMAPEQIRGEELTSAADVYSLGVMAFEMLAGRAPFDGEGTALMYRIVHETPPSVSTLNAALPAGLSAVVDRALTKQPEDRWPSAGAFALALGETLQGAPLPDDRTVAVGVIADATQAASVAVPPVGASAAIGAASPQPPGSPGWMRSPMPMLLGGGAMIVLAILAFMLLGGGGDETATAGGTATEAATAGALVASPTTTTTPSATPTTTSTQKATDTPSPEATATVQVATVVAAATQPPATVAPTLAPTIVAATPTATAAPTLVAAQYYSTISGISLQGTTYVVNFSVQGFTQTGSIADRHVHFFFNTVSPQQAGVPGSGPWSAYGGGSPFTGHNSAQAGTATQMCILVANTDHSVIQGTGNCVNLP